MSAATFLDVFRLAARQAGAVASRLQGRVAAETKTGFATPEAEALSLADLATQDVILLALAEALPGIAVDAEEETASRETFAAEGPGRPLVVVDPIDGSWNFLHGSDDWAVMAAWVQDGRYRAALLEFPRWEETWWAVAGEGAWRQRRGRPAERARVATADDRVLLVPGPTGDAAAALESAGFRTERGRCSAVDGIAPAVPRAGAAYSANPLDRRFAIAAFVGLEAGATVLVGGREWKADDPGYGLFDAPTVVAADPDHARRVARAAAG